MKKLLINDVAKLQASIKDKTAIFNRLLDQYNFYLTMETPATHPPGSTTYFGMAAANLSLLYLLTNQQQYLNEAKRWIFAGCNYRQWGHAHLVDVDLSASFMLFGFALSYDWLKAGLTSSEKQVIKEKLYLQGQKMVTYIEQNRHQSWVCKYWQNHNWINFTGLATAALVLADDYPQTNSWLQLALDNMEKVYSLLPEDGSDYEGIVYWRYGVIWLFIFADLMKVSKNIDFFATPFLQNTLKYKIYQMLPGVDQSFTFGDTHDSYSSHSVALYQKIASCYQDPYAKELANIVSEKFIYKEAYFSKIKPGILPETFLEFIWCDPFIAPAPLSKLPTSYYFADLGLFSYRSSWQDEAIAFSIKCGYPGGKKQFIESFKIALPNQKLRSLSHQHPDNNSFLIAAGNQLLIIDDGYNRNCKALYHNTLTIDDCGYCKEDVNDVFANINEENYGQVEAVLANEEFAFFVGESAKMYHPDFQLQLFLRHFLYVDNYIIIFDQIASAKEHIYTLNFQYPHQLIKKDNHYCLLSGQSRLTHFPGNHVDVDFKTHFIKAIMTTQEPDKFVSKYLHDFQVKSKQKSTNALFANVLVVNKEVQVEHQQTNLTANIIIREADLVTYIYFNDLTNPFVKAEGKILMIQLKQTQIMKIFGYQLQQLVVDNHDYHHQIKNNPTFYYSRDRK